MKRKHGLDVIVFVMLLYQAWRVWDYMYGNLAGVDPGTAWWIASAFLFFTEVALLGWMHFGAPAATTTAQEGVSGLMVWADYAGSMIIGLADLAKHNTMYAVDLSRIDGVLFIAPFVLVAINVGAWIVYKQHDSEDLLRKAERALAHAEHELEIHARMNAVEEVRANSQGISRQLAPYYFKDMHDRVTGRTAAKFGRQAEKLPPMDYQPPAPRPGLADKLAGLLGKNGNGHSPNIVNYNAESAKLPEPEPEEPKVEYRAPREPRDK